MARRKTRRRTRRNIDGIDGLETVGPIAVGLVLLGGLGFVAYKHFSQPAVNKILPDGSVRPPDHLLISFGIKPGTLAYPTGQLAKDGKSFIYTVGNTSFGFNPATGIWSD